MSSRNYDHLDSLSYGIRPNHENYLVESIVYDFCLNKENQATSIFKILYLPQT